MCARGRKGWVSEEGPDLTPGPVKQLRDRSYKWGEEGRAAAEVPQSERGVLVSVIEGEGPMLGLGRKQIALDGVGLAQWKGKVIWGYESARILMCMVSEK